MGPGDCGVGAVSDAEATAIRVVLEQVPTTDAKPTPQKCTDCTAIHALVAAAKTPLRKKSRAKPVSLALVSKKPSDAPDFDDRRGGSESHDHRHLQKHSEEIADIVGRMFAETLRAIPTLQ